MIYFEGTVRDLTNRQCRVDFDVEEVGEQLIISGVCSCGSHTVCSHMSALIHEFRENHEAKGTLPVEEECLTWLNHLGSQKAEEGGGQQSVLCYRLSPLNYRFGVLKVTLTVARLKKDGNPGKGRDLSFESLRSSNALQADYISALDREIIPLLAASIPLSPLSWQKEEIILTGELGALALEKMMNSERCFWESEGGASLSWGEARALQLQWEEGKGERRLLVTAGVNGYPLVTTPAYYVDMAAVKIGVISDPPFSALQLERLMAAPAVPTQLEEAFSRQLVVDYPDLPIPPPRSPEIEEIVDTLPTPCLELQGFTLGDGYGHRLALSFSYDGQEIDPIPPRAQTVIASRPIVRIHRQLEAEQAAVALLEKIGFHLVGEERGEAGPFLLEPTGEEAAAVVELWQQFELEELPRLRLEGWQVRTAESYLLEFHQLEDLDATIDETGNAWFDLRFDLKVEGEVIPLLPLITQLIGQYTPTTVPESISVQIRPHHYVAIGSERIRPILNILYELFGQDRVRNRDTLRISRFDVAALTELEQGGEQSAAITLNGGKNLRELGKKLKQFQGVEAVEVPQGFKGTLRSYQREGLNWLQFLREFSFGGVLADDMGLGKTVQTLSHLQLEKEAGRLTQPVLIVAPTSLMGNWRREAAEFTPQLSVLVLQGSERFVEFDKIGDHDLILTTYPLLPRDQEVLLRHHYHSVILDEAQVIKNPKAKASKLVRQLKCDHRLCLTGTPMENHLGELWALFDFLLPGFLGTAPEFTRLYRTPIEKQGDMDRRQRLSKRIKPFMLRRKKQEVEKELPPKTEIVLTVPLGAEQAALYESIRLSMESKVRKSIASKGLSRSHITILDALLKLRQTCCDPRLLSLQQAQLVKESAKLEMLLELLPELLEEGRRILLFSQFTTMLALIEDELTRLKIDYAILTGQTRLREAAIDLFRSGKVDLFLISLKAGGVGLNLVEADTVIHYDPWWNPAVEAQATDRAHRIGQERPVFVYKLLTEKTVEEKIIAMQARKQSLADGVYGEGEEAATAALSADELTHLFRSE
ncbi:MAG: DEAD/DEAH box helicase [Gammaproteobacteria bacterium]|nr:DEAD/DEAH box helicase [Gammaproteobacteria bacterium]